jgi:hypothetical protein
MSLKARASTHLLTAQSEDQDNSRLRVLTDESSYKLASKVYKTYISTDDFSQFHPFMIDFDRLLARFGGQPIKIATKPGDQQQQKGAPPKQPQAQDGGNTTNLEDDDE